LTEKTLKALKILQDNPNIAARRFAKLMWPDSIMHRRVSNTGNGATTGKAGWLCGGSYLAKLCNKELVYRYLTSNGYTWTFSLSRKGVEVLNG